MKTRCRWCAQAPARAPLDVCDDCDRALIRARGVIPRSDRDPYYEPNDDASRNDDGWYTGRAQ